eukprot:NODE_465_length_7087_cov_1.060962.p6 type:complete len:110 gc:universal NODE_465_length_7087_cov_1.060962:3324-2995(-)
MHEQSKYGKTQMTLESCDTTPSVLICKCFCRNYRIFLSSICIPLVRTPHRKSIWYCYIPLKCRFPLRLIVCNVQASKSHDVQISCIHFANTNASPRFQCNLFADFFKAY